MKLALLGGKGMLAGDFAPLAAKAGFDVVPFDLPDFDITDAGHVAEAARGAAAIVNCAAYTAVDKAESEPDLCRRVNADALDIIGRAALKNGAFVLHISTDFVFGDSSSRAHRETDQTNPLGVYGATKLEGEKILAATGCGHAVVRVQWTYGASGNNFVFKIAELAKKLDRLKVVDDQTGAPTWTFDVSRAMLCLLQKRASGLWHFAADGFASRFETARLILEKLGIEKELVPCKTSDFPAPAKRPLNSRFDCSKIDGILDFKRPVWRDSLTTFIDKFSDKF